VTPRACNRQEVVAGGDVVAGWNPAAVEAGGRSRIVCPVVAPEGAPRGTPSVEPGMVIRAGGALFEWN